MAVILGKRKRRADVQSVEQQDRSDHEESSADEDTARTLFQKAFEAKFEPLEKNSKLVEVDDEDLSDEEVASDGDSDWSGFSENEDEVEIVEHVVPDTQQIDEIFSSKKTFMSSKPPLSEDTIKASRSPAKAKAIATQEDDDTTTATEAHNLKNDLDLQRLLKESHLLDPASFSSSTTPEGKSRLKALDLRLQSLGAKTSVLQQEKMPLAHRRGIASKSASREATRRKDAAENGVILEKARSGSGVGGGGKGQKMKKTMRDRGIGAPGLGKFRGGTLRLSSRDVASIQSFGERRGRGAGKRGRR